MARGLAYKRHHQRRRIKRVLRDFHHWYAGPEWLQRNVDTITRCSCYMCGNPRHHFGEKTRQEQVADLEETEQKEGVE